MEHSPRDLEDLVLSVGDVGTGSDGSLMFVAPQDKMLQTAPEHDTHNSPGENGHEAGTVADPFSQFVASSSENAIGASSASGAFEELEFQNMEEVGSLIAQTDSQLLFTPLLSPAVSEHLYHRGMATQKAWRDSYASTMGGPPSQQPEALAYGGFVDDADAFTLTDPAMASSPSVWSEREYARGNAFSTQQRPLQQPLRQQQQQRPRKRRLDTRRDGEETHSSATDETGNSVSPPEVASAPAPAPMTPALLMQQQQQQLVKEEPQPEPEPGAEPAQPKRETSGAPSRTPNGTPHGTPRLGPHAGSSVRSGSKRSSISLSGSYASISPQLRPNLPEGLGKDAVVAQLAAKSNYQHILDGTHEQVGISVPADFGKGLDLRRSTHKQAEQRRRDYMKTCFDDLRALLPPVKEEALNTSKASVLRRTVDFMAQLRKELGERDEQVAALRKEAAAREEVVSRLREEVEALKGEGR